MKEMRVVCGVLEKNGKIYMARRAPGQNLAGYWELPGGKIEPGETQEQALVREFREELGLRVLPIKYVKTVILEQNEKKLELNAWRVLDLTGAEPALNVHDQGIWIQVKKALDPQLGFIFRIASADIGVIEALE